MPIVFRMSDAKKNTMIQARRKFLQMTAGAAAGGSVGTGRVARAAPDGYSLILGGWATHVVNAATLTLPYDVVKDFEPVGMVVTQPLMLVGNNAFAPRTLRELLDWLKANPDKGSMGTSGVGSATHIAADF